MPKIWTEQGNVKETPNRNNFDKSRQVHLTMKPGGLYPVMCDFVVPGDSFDIKAAFGLKFMPMVFPVQSRMRAHMYFFNVRHKNIWKNWENFAQQLEDHTHPYIEQPSSWFKTGSLADYLNIPTTSVGSKYVFNHFISPTFDPSVHISRGQDRGSIGGNYSVISSAVTSGNTSTVTVTGQPMPILPIQCWPTGEYQFNELVKPFAATGTQLRSLVIFPTKLTSAPVFDSNHYIYFTGNNLNRIPNGTLTLALWINRPGHDFYTEGTLNWNNTDFFLSGNIDLANNTFSDSHVFRLVNYTSGDANAFSNKISECIAAGYDCYLSVIVPTNVLQFGSTSSNVTRKIDEEDVVFNISFFNDFYYTSENAYVTDSTIKPFGSEVVDGQRIRINALPFRAYESVYQCFFRNSQNQPFYINGVEQFNKYNTTVEDGADTTDYHIFFRNYEMDYLTSCLQSPQQGIAPLVGLTDTGTITIADENGITTGTYEVDEHGTIGQVVVTSPNASAEHGRIAMSLATAGFTINDFRGTNALSRWLEMNLRRGYKYMDFIEGHFGQSPHYDSLDMPEFIGGFSQDVQVNMISSTADTLGSGGLALGEFAGQANCFGMSNSEIRHYCDDFGYIIGILCVVPTPSYSQILPKDFLRSSPLDYPYPEFSHLGLQPITYREVCPIQSYQEYLDTQGASGNNSDTFGYQRPNYDLVGNIDEIHGQFRSTMKNYLVNRVFSERPQLGTQFLEINPEEINDIFTVTDPAEDTIIGQVVLDVKAKRPFPRVVVPNLGK